MDAWIRYSCPWIQFVPGGAVGVYLYEKMVDVLVLASAFDFDIDFVGRPIGSAGTRC